MLIKIWKEADYLGMHLLITFIMKKLYNSYPHTGIKEVKQMLHLVLPCYDTIDHSSPRKWIADLFAIGLGDFEKSIPLDELRDKTCPDILLDVLYQRARINDSLKRPPTSVATERKITSNFAYASSRYESRWNGSKPRTKNWGQ